MANRIQSISIRNATESYQENSIGGGMSVEKNHTVKANELAIGPLVQLLLLLIPRLNDLQKNCFDLFDIADLLTATLDDVGGGNYHTSLTSDEVDRNHYQKVLANLRNTYGERGNEKTRALIESLTLDEVFALSGFSAHLIKKSAGHNSLFRLLGS